MGCKFTKIRSSRRGHGKEAKQNQGGGKIIVHTKDRDGNEKELTEATINKLVNIGIDEKLANDLAKRRGKGELKSTGDVVAVLERNDTKYQVRLEDDILVRVDSWGELVCEKSNNESGGLHEEVTKRLKLKDRININTARKSSLEKIKGIGPALAGRIIQYREQHGPFARVDDIASVRGVSGNLVKKISSQITVEDPENDEFHNLDNKKESKKSHKIPKFVSNSKTVRVATWNLLSFSSDKANNDGVKEVICRLILENGVDILAVQEIGDKTALEKIRDELNNPTSEALKDWAGPHGHWECRTSDVAGQMFRSKEYNGFLWNKLVGVDLKSDALLEQPKTGGKQFARRPYLGFFKAKKFDFVLVSVHLKATGLGNEDISRLQKELAKIPDLVQALQTHLKGEKDTIILGDFNLGPDADEFDAMRKASLSNIIPGSTFTNISMKNMQGSKNYDNMWISKHTKLHHFTGQAGVVREGLTHPSIPDGWGWNGLVSDHCPVWAEFHCDRDLDDTAEGLDVHGIAIDGK